MMVNGSANNSAGKGGGTIVFLLIAVVALFIIIVCYGWLHLLLPMIGDQIVAGVLALLLTVIALLLARYIGDQRALTRIGSDDGGERVIDWLFFYPFLFLISAMGTMNTAFYRFEGAAVLQNDIDMAQEKLQRLESTSGEVLGEPAYQARQQALNTLLAALKPEIVDDKTRIGKYCGVGANALVKIGEIKKLLPGFTLPAGIVGRNRCGTADFNAIYNGLETQARQILDTTINPVLAALQADIMPAQAKLSHAETGLDFAANGKLDETGYFRAQEALKDAATAYADGRARVVSAVSADAAAKLPPELRLYVDRSLNLGSVFSLLPTLWSRIGYGATWVYTTAAVLLDIALVFLFMQVGLGARDIGAVRVRRILGDPEFLWVNPSS